ncbi:MAG UNVERIFIED_CONTAM: hypothetical protein LVR18_31085 [Planctomycetaceae bacterium]|jgi:hypothetical protein
MAEQTDVQRRYREFLDLMPLTLALAGLPQRPREIFHCRTDRKPTVHDTPRLESIPAGRQGVHCRIQFHKYSLDRCLICQSFSAEHGSFRWDLQAVT